ncbi:hypothetical protein CR513_27917, partial [Mucuna pruriens]
MLYWLTGKHTRLCWECLPTGSCSVKFATCRFGSNIELTRQSRSVTWPMTKPAKKGNFSCRNWKSSAWKHTKTPKSTTKRKIGQKVLLFHSRLKLIAAKLRSRWDKPFVITNGFPYGVVKLRDEANNRIFKVNGNQINPFHEGLTLMVGKKTEMQTAYIIENKLEYKVRNSEFPENLPSTTIALEGRRWCTVDG